MPLNSINQSMLRSLIKNGKNVVLVGPAGVGKTMQMKSACKALGLKLKVLNAPTLDAYSNLIGIPVTNDAKDEVNFIRPSDVMNAEVIFIDEFNRPNDEATLNALFEILQFSTINGVKLPNLKCVCAAMNPDDEGYNVAELDIALLDRFDIYVDMPAAIDRAYFVRKYGANVGSAAVKLWNDYNKDYESSKRSKRNQMGYLSPRKMEEIVDNYFLLKSRAVIQGSIPPKVTLTAGSVERSLNEAISKDNPPKRTAAPKASTPVNKPLRSSMAGYTRTDIRRSPFTAEKFLKEARNYDEALDFVADSISKSIGPDRLSATNWIDVFAQLGRDRCQNIVKAWAPSKREKLLELMGQKLNTAGVDIARQLFV